MAHDFVEPADKELPHGSPFHLVDFLQRLSKSNGKELGHHVKVGHDCDTIKLINQGGELGQRVCANLSEVFGVGEGGEDVLAMAEQRRVKHLKKGLLVTFHELEAARDRNLWVDAGIEEVCL